MIRLRHILAGILILAVMTLWVPERWAVSLLESEVFLCSAGVCVQIILRRRSISFGLPAILLSGMWLWALMQLAGRWSAVPAETGDACLYWLTAACLAWLGQQACEHREQRCSVLRILLAAGAGICLLGILQLFTSAGHVFWLFPSGYDSEVIGPFVSRNNFASFVELILPVAFVLSWRGGRHAKTYLAVAAALVACVIASGSRAGTVIVMAESAVVLLLLRRTPPGSSSRRWIGFAMLTAAFTAVMGYQSLYQRLGGDRDPYGVRRELVESTLAMARAEPLHGFGFGSWPSAYRQFATIDTGLEANHSHNEWAQWAAEGGLVAPALMLAVLLVSGVTAWRSVWGLGVIAVFLHALVDYPFLRLGLASWAFVLIGALSGYRAERRDLARFDRAKPRTSGPMARTLAAIAVPLLILAVWQSARLAWADALYRRSTPEDILRAVELCPDRAEYQLAAAEAMPAQAVPRLRRALALNPFLTAARIELANRLEEEGDFGGAEGMLLEAADSDREYAPAWALANFYFRTHKEESFWRWAQTAARISYGGFAPLFDLCFLVSDDAATVLDRGVPRRARAEREYLAYLISHGRMQDLRGAAFRLAADATGDDRDSLLEYTDRALDAGDLQGALGMWNELSRRKLIPYAELAPGGFVNEDLRRPFLDHAFDWRPTAGLCAVVARTIHESAAIQISFSGRQPENCVVLEHFAPLVRDGLYVLKFEFRTRDLPDRTGLRWSVGSGQAFDFQSSETWSRGEWRFQAAAEAACLILGYRRIPGTSRMPGSVLIREIRLELEPTVLGETRR